MTRCLGVYNGERCFVDGPINHRVESKLCLWQDEVLLFWRFIDQTPEHYSQSSVDYLCLAICLGMVTIAIVQSCVKLPPQNLPKVTNELHVLVGGDKFWNSMQLNDFFEKQVHNIASISSLLIRQEMCHFSKLVNNNKNRVKVSWSFRQSQDEVHAKVLPNVLCNRKWSIETSVLCLTYSYLTYIAPLH